MDQILEILHLVMPALYILAGIAIIAKVFFVVSNKGFNLPAIIISFFRIYTRDKFNTANVKRKNFMRANNYINYFLYAVTALFILQLIVYQGDVFNYS
ncbi:MAG TPA: hypothetical protein VG738_08370 [Chitinophagaceae bacterium]|nr:hypothetical protein [Chitinophagaceae bacterium]